MTVVKEQRRASNAYALSYAVALPTLQDVARTHGYALAIHGSMATDMDLIAAPWTDSASDADTLVTALRDCIGGMFSGGVQTAKEAEKINPHGRLSYSILPSDLFLGVPHLPWYPWIDVSVLPRQSNINPLNAALEAVLNSDMAIREEDEGRQSEVLNIVRDALGKS